MTYELFKRSGDDFRLEDSPDVVIMTRLREDDSLSPDTEVRLAHATFVPAGQRARLSLRMPRDFAWPEEDNEARDDKLKAFVNGNLEHIAGFALFEQATRFQVDLPAGWEKFETASAR
jgi:hypothetical protein